MAVQRKCTKCGTWNGAEDYCTSCGEVLSPEIIEEIREQKREEIRNNTPPSGFDKFIDNWKNSRFFLLRVLYKVVYAIGFTFFAIASFFAWLAASPNG